jgi:hypothetical protein
MGIIIFLFWIGFAVVVGVAANTRGRNGTGWCLLALAISPLLAGLLLLALPRYATARVERDPRWINLRSTSMPRTNNRSFYVGVIVWVVCLLIVGIGIIAGLKSKPQDVTPVAAHAAPAVAKAGPAKPLPGQEVSEQYFQYVKNGDAGWKCNIAIKNAAQYDLRWTNWGADFSRWNKYARPDGYIQLVGDLAEAQNGFGNWVRVNYSCLFDPDRGVVISASIERGRLPSN